MKCVRCNHQITDDAERCVLCGKVQSEGPDISDGSPNYAEKIKIKHILDNQSILIDEIGLYSDLYKVVEQKQVELENKRNTEYAKPKPEIPEVKVPPRPEYPKLDPQMKFKYKWNWNKLKWSNPIPSIILIIISGFVFFLGLICLAMNNELTSMLGTLLMFVGGAAIIATIICLTFFVVEASSDYKSQKSVFDRRCDLRIQQLSQNETYKKKCQEIDDAYQQQLIQANKAYQDEKEHYNNIILPLYNKEKAEWEESKAYAVQRMETDVIVNQQNLNQLGAIIQSTIDHLNGLYREYRLLPDGYNSPESVQRIYNIMDTSVYDTKTALEIYDRQINMQIQSEQVRQSAINNQISFYQALYAKVQTELAQQQITLTEEQNDIIRRARRDNNIANIIHTIQHHNTNTRLDRLLNQ